jgi:hypothetical protein
MSELDLAGLAAHYAGELEREGWTMISESVGEEVVRQAWRFENGSGESWSGVFLVSQIPNTERKGVVFHLSEP